nr:hypothetical protein CFP56_34661 [Quercus suber]
MYGSLVTLGNPISHDGSGDWPAQSYATLWFPERTPDPAAHIAFCYPGRMHWLCTVHELTVGRRTSPTHPLRRCFGATRPLDSPTTTNIHTATCSSCLRRRSFPHHPAARNRIMGGPALENLDEPGWDPLDSGMSHLTSSPIQDAQYDSRVSEISLKVRRWN